MTRRHYLEMSNASPERQRQRLEAKMPADRSGCWTWTGQTLGSGYGMMRTGPGSRDYVHRVSYRLNKGPIPDGFQIDHLCRNRGCFNPDHLEAVPGRTNWARGYHVNAVAHRTDRCAKKLHDLTGDNVMKGERRRCRACHQAWLDARASASTPE